ncbi:MAG: STAS domain-containing protein [Desulfomonilaceae bacterium]|nr:STAS domain-containing protein [Desulfomonilaceae bacterium]
MDLKVVDINPGLTHISLTGKLDVEGEEQIGGQFEQLTSAAGKPTVVDMSNVTYLASLGIRLLFTCAKSLAAEGKKLVVVNPQPMVEETLRTSGTAGLIPIARDVREAYDILGIP